MKQVYLLNLDQDCILFEEEEKQKLLQSILDELSVDYGDLFANQSTHSKVKLKSILSKYNISTIDDEEFIIFVDNKQIAKMSKPFYKIKKDITSKNRKNLFIEAEINFWTIYDEDK